MTRASELSNDYMKPEEFLHNAKSTNVFNNAVKELTEKRNGEVGDQDQVRANETWSLLANQVVGQEIF